MPVDAAELLLTSSGGTDKRPSRRLLLSMGYGSVSSGITMDWSTLLGRLEPVGFPLPGLLITSFDALSRSFPAAHHAR